MIQVTKASGQTEPLSLDKVRQSLYRAGAEPATIDKILLELKPKLYDKIATREIYSQVFALFNRFQKNQSFHYSLKPALMDLGPSGYPFEDFIARLFTAMGYQTQTRVIIQGKCISHEVDVVAQKSQQKFLIECKFHNRPGTKTESKDALYTQARFEDINSQHPGVYQKTWLVTNTKLTSQAIQYGRCQNMELLAWRYPAKGSLESLLEQYQIQPLTCLSFLTHQEKQQLFNHELVLCREVKAQTDKQLSALGLADKTIKNIRSSLN